MIGVFDSGYGGLTILHGLLDAMPEYSYMYLGDNARAPYGVRSAEEILEFTRQGVEFLFNQGCELVIIGCNTASAVALSTLQQDWLLGNYPDKKLLGIVVPTVEQITGMPWLHVGPIECSQKEAVTTIGIMATKQTIESGAYRKEILKRNQSINIVEQVCTELVTMIETGVEREVIQAKIKEYVVEMLRKVESNKPPLQAVLLGCTHFAIIADLIKQELPEHVTLYEQPVIVAKSLQQYIERHEELKEILDTTKNVRKFYTTELQNEKVSHLSKKFFGKTIVFTACSI